jgi:hypothetical protein
LPVSDENRLLGGVDHRDQFGPVVERNLLSTIVFAMFGAGVVVMAAGC